MIVALLAAAALAQDPEPSPSTAPINIVSGRLGGALQPHNGVMLSGIAVGGDYRYEEGRLGLRAVPIEIAILDNEEAGASALRINTLRLEGYYIFRPDASVSPYVGGGLGGAIHLLGDETASYFDLTIDSTLTGGIAVARSRRIRWMLEGDLVLPLNRVTSAYGLEESWPLMATVRLNAAWRTNVTIGEIVAAWAEQLTD